MRWDTKEVWIVDSVGSHSTLDAIEDIAGVVKVMI